MSNQEKDSLPSATSGKEAEQSVLEQIPSAEVATEPDGAASTGRVATRLGRGSVSSTGRRSVRGAPKTKQEQVECSQRGWSKKEICSHHLGQAKQLAQKPSSNLHEGKDSFARMKAKFQALMSEQR